MTSCIFLSILLGIVLLACSLPSIASILRTLGESELKRHWVCLRTLILLFLAGYAAFGLLHLRTSATTADLIVSAILASGGGFVLIVARLSDVTTRDVMRITALERDVVRDPLTGLFNRRYLDVKLTKEISRSCRSSSSLSALLIDLDHFKNVNDTYGHMVGDHVIQQASELIVGQAHANDTVVRYGGEEFIVLAPDKDIEAAVTLAERIRGTIANRDLVLPDGRTLNVTVSLGVSVFDPTMTKAEFLRDADDAMYAAKRAGRNCLCRAASRSLSKVESVFV